MKITDAALTSADSARSGLISDNSHFVDKSNLYARTSNPSRTPPPMTASVKRSSSSPIPAITSIAFPHSVIHEAHGITILWNKEDSERISVRLKNRIRICEFSYFEVVVRRTNGNESAVELRLPRIVY